MNLHALDREKERALSALLRLSYPEKTSILDLGPWPTAPGNRIRQAGLASELGFASDQSPEFMEIVRLLAEEHWAEVKTLDFGGEVYKSIRITQRGIGQALYLRTPWYKKLIHAAKQNRGLASGIVSGLIRLLSRKSS